MTSLGRISTFFYWCSNFILEKRIHNIFQNPETTTIFENKVKFVDYRMKWIVLPYSESYFEDSKYIFVKFYQFSCIQEFYLTYIFRKRKWIAYNFSAFLICERSCRISILCAHFFTRLYLDHYFSYLSTKRSCVTGSILNRGVVHSPTLHLTQISCK